MPEGPSHLRVNPEQPDPGGPELPLLLNKINPVDERPDAGQDDNVLVLKVPREALSDHELIHEPFERRW